MPVPIPSLSNGLRSVPTVGCSQALGAVASCCSMPPPASSDDDLPGNGDVGWLVNFSGDGTRVATVTFDKREALVWDVGSGELRARLPLGEGGEAIDFGTHGSTVYTAGSDSSLRHWDIDGDRRFIAQVAFAPPRLADLSFAQPVPWRRLHRLPQRGHITFLDVKANAVGEPLATRTGLPSRWRELASRRCPLRPGDRRRDPDLGCAQRRADLNGRPSGRYVSGIDYSTDGSRLVIGELSGRMTMLDPATLNPVGRPVRARRTRVLRLGRAGQPHRHRTDWVHEASGFWVGSSTRWTLVDLESGTVVEQGPLGINGQRGRLLAGRPTRRRRWAGR